MGYAEESESLPNDRAKLELRFGDEVKVFTGEDTLVRRFLQGDGEFDHCVHVTAEGFMVAFTPTREALERFVELGFPVRVDLEIDDATMEHYARIQAAHMDEEDVL